MLPPPRPRELFASRKPCRFQGKLGEVVRTPEKSPFEMFPGRTSGMARPLPQIDQLSRARCQKFGHCVCSHCVQTYELAVPLSVSGAHLGPPQESQSLTSRYHV